MNINKQKILSKSFFLRKRKQNLYTCIILKQRKEMFNFIFQKQNKTRSGRKSKKSGINSQPERQTNTHQYEQKRKKS